MQNLCMQNSITLFNELSWAFGDKITISLNFQLLINQPLVYMYYVYATLAGLALYLRLFRRLTLKSAFVASSTKHLPLNTCSKIFWFLIFNFYEKSFKMSRDMVPINMRDPFMKDPFFSSTWAEFDKINHDMMEKSKCFWGKVDKVRGCL